MEVPINKFYTILSTILVWEIAYCLRNACRDWLNRREEIEKNKEKDLLAKWTTFDKPNKPDYTIVRPEPNNDNDTIH